MYSFKVVVIDSVARVRGYKLIKLNDGIEEVEGDYDFFRCKFSDVVVNVVRYDSVDFFLCEIGKKNNG